MPEMTRRELLALGITFPFTHVTYKASIGTSEEARYGPRDSDDPLYDAWLDDYEKGVGELGVDRDRSLYGL